MEYDFIEGLSFEQIESSYDDVLLLSACTQQNIYCSIGTISVYCCDGNIYTAQNGSRTGYSSGNPDCSDSSMKLCGCQAANAYYSAHYIWAREATTSCASVPTYYHTCRSGWVAEASSFRC